MNSINYYIQLSDYASTIIDSLNRQELLKLSSDVLNIYNCLYTQNVGHATVFVRDKRLEFGVDSLPTLAHGLLAKAL